MSTSEIMVGDCRDVLETLNPGSVQTCVTSPPYFGLRDYATTGQIGQEASLDEFVEQMSYVFSIVRRVLRSDGTLWLNLGDCYGPNKQLSGVPWRVAFALQADGWYLRSDIIWAKPNPMPESVTDRPTSAHEHIFLFAKSAKYHYDADAIREEPTKSTLEDARHGLAVRRNMDEAAERYGANTSASRRSAGSYFGIGDGGRNKRNVWTVATQPYASAHFATFPPNLIEPCIRAGSREGDTVLDPFNGAGTTGLVAQQNGRSYIGIELNPEYAAITRDRLAGINEPLPGMAA